jgi:mRNA-degrading endonuclease RelE of RelBE toxin-antitoxin system
MKFTIDIDEDALHELADLKAFHRKKIANEIDKQLVHQADTPSKNRKLLQPEKPETEFDVPLWELRVGEYRVIYEVDRDQSMVHVRAVRHKPPEKRTKDIVP